MQFIKFKEALKEFPLFTYSDIRKIEPDFQRRRLVEWQNKGYVRKIRQGIYSFSDQSIGEDYLFYASNRIYKPSYVSLESAFAYYNLIPEGVYIYTGITTNKTKSFDTSIGNYFYRNVKPSLFFGYQLVRMHGFNIKIAEPEKLILDYCYFKKIEDPEKIADLRINKEIANEIIDPAKLDRYQSIYNSKVMDRKINFFKIFLYA